MIKNIVYTFLFAAIALASCNKEPQAMSKQQLQWKTDSIVAAQNKFSEQEAKKDLERRIKIEVRVKADSILNERLHPSKPKDTQPAPLGTQPPGIFPKQH